MGQFVTFISNSLSFLPPLARNVVTLLQFRRIPVATNIVRGRGEEGGGVAANDNESLNMVMETAYRCVE